MHWPTQTVKSFGFSGSWNFEKDHIRGLSASGRTTMVLFFAKMNVLSCARLTGVKPQERFQSGGWNDPSRPYVVKSVTCQSQPLFRTAQKRINSVGPWSSLSQESEPQAIILCSVSAQRACVKTNPEKRCFGTCLKLNRDHLTKVARKNRAKNPSWKLKTKQKRDPASLINSWCPCPRWKGFAKQSQSITKKMLSAKQSQ